MRRTRLSLVYTAGYLLPAGAALSVAPDWALDVLGSTGTYGDVMPRVAGIALLALGALVVQIVRHRVEVLYLTTLLVRAGIAAGLIAVYAASGDPAFLVVFVVVTVGVLLTAAAYRLDRRPAPFGRVGRAMDSVETR
ncbi:MAG: hypothetical protein WD770_02765 [Actinomycetota bacterium]